MLNIGCHLSASKGFLHMAKETMQIKGNTFQFFTRNPRGGQAKDLNQKDIDKLCLSDYVQNWFYDEVTSDEFKAFIDKLAGDNILE